MNNVPAFRARFVGGILEVVCAAKLAVVLTLLGDMVRFFPACYDIR